jgi:hypothetical protein
MTICYVEGVSLRLANSWDRTDALTPYKQKHALKLSTIHQMRRAVLWFEKGIGREGSPGSIQGDNFWGPS